MRDLAGNETWGTGIGPIDKTEVINGEVGQALDVQWDSIITYNGCKAMIENFIVQSGQEITFAHPALDAPSSDVVRNTILTAVKTKKAMSHRDYILNGCSLFVINRYHPSAITGGLTLPWQQDALDKIMEWYGTVEWAGQGMMAVSFGKSTITPPAMDMVCEADPKCRLLGYGVPWRSLNDQAAIKMLQTFERLHGRNHPYRVLALHSGEIGNAFDEFEGKIAKYTAKNADAAVEHMLRWRDEGLRAVVIYCYRSAQMLFDALKRHGVSLDFAVHDEAHRLSKDSLNFQLVGRVNDPEMAARVKVLDKSITALRKLETKQGFHTKAMRLAMAELQREKKRVMDLHPLVATDIPIKRIWSHTATPTSAQARGGMSMENTTIFGNKWFSFSFDQLAETGYVVTPDIRHVKTDPAIVDELSRRLANLSMSRGTDEDDDIDDEDITNFAAIIATMQAAIPIIKGDIKGIVYLKSLRAVEAITGETFKISKRAAPSRTYELLVRETHLILLEILRHHLNFEPRIHCVYGGHNAQERMDRYEQFQAPGHALFINCKTLAEGVDFPSANVALVNRKADSTEIVQIMGRLVRLHDNDRSRIQAGLLDANRQCEGYFKSRALVCIAERVNSDPMGLGLAMMTKMLHEYIGGNFEEPGHGGEGWGFRTHPETGEPEDTSRWAELLKAIHSAPRDLWDQLEAAVRVEMAFANFDASPSSRYTFHSLILCILRLGELENAADLDTEQRRSVYTVQAEILKVREFGPADLEHEMWNDRFKGPRWKHNCHWGVLELRRQGLVAEKVRHAWWGLTEAGREVADHLLQRNSGLEIKRRLDQWADIVPAVKENGQEQTQPMFWLKMSWQQMVARTIHTLLTVNGGDSVTRTQVIGYAPLMAEQHPGKSHKTPQYSADRAMQELRDNGVIAHFDRYSPNKGIYRVTSMEALLDACN